MNFSITSFLKVLIALSTTVPLVIGNYYPSTIAPKVFLFYTIVLFMVGLYAILLLLNREKYRVQLTPITVAVIFFGLSVAISTILSVDWRQSMWDGIWRMTGAFFIFHVILYYFIVTSIVHEWKDWQRLFKILLIVGAAVVFLGLGVQTTGPAEFCNLGSGRIYSTLGNSAFFGGFTMFLVFLGYLVFFREKRASWLFFIFFTILLTVIGLFASGTRSALLGFVSGFGFVSISYFVFFFKTRKFKPLLWIFLLFVPIVVLGVSWVIVCQTSEVQDVPVVGRFVGDGLTNNINERFSVWGVAVKGWQEKPFFGWGPATFEYIFNKNFPPEIIQYGKGDIWFDKAHSAPFETLATKGIVGFLAYLGLFGVTAFMLWRGHQRKLIDIHVFSLGGGFLIAHFIHNLFLFETPTSYIYFFFFLAFLNSRTVKNPKSKYGPTECRSWQQRKPKYFFSYTALIIVIIIFLLLFYGFMSTASQAMWQAINRVSENESETIELYWQVRRIPSPYQEEFWVYFFDKKISQEMSKEFFLLAHTEIVQIREQNPRNLRAYLLQAKIDRIGYDIFLAPYFLVEAESILKEGLRISPERKEFEDMLAQIQSEIERTR